MGAVGAFPGIDWKRRTIRGPVNPLDKATIVSICPKRLHDKKWTLNPGEWTIEPGTFDNPSILTVGPSSWWRDIDEETPILEIPVPAITIAQSVVTDYCNGMIGCDMETRRPGWFYILGCKFKTEPGKEEEPDEKATIAWIKTDFKKQLEVARDKQKAWYFELIKQGDAMWARSNGNPLALSDDMRLAAREAGVADTKDWMKDFRAVEMVRCKACGALKNPAYPICATCRNVDMSHPGAKDLKFAS